MKIISGLVNGQVLQRIGKRGASAELQGECRSAGSVTATLTGARGALKGWNRRVVGSARRGTFRATLPGIPAGGPYRLEMRCGEESVRVAAFFVGDVWILAGQSNMEGVGLISGKARPHPLVRAFSMRRVWRLATDPLHIMAESSDRCHQESGQPCSVAEGEMRRRTAIKGTGVGVFFGREMFERTGVPQGLVCTAHGGTSMQQWNPQRKKLGGESLYASMIESVRATGQPVAGMLWYQGESDANELDAPLYTARMRELVAATRRDLRLPRLPWIVVQIGKHFGQTANWSPWNEVQEAERLLPKRIAHLETVAAIDLPMDDGIHIGADGYPLLARRLARMADRLVHGNRRELPPPAPRRVRQLGKPAGTVLEVTFDHVVGGLQAVGIAAGFTLINEAGEPVPIIYRTRLMGQTVQLLMERPLPHGVRLVYGCGRAPVCTLTDGRGLAVPVFGPMRIQGTKALPFVTSWTVSDIVTDAPPLAKVSVPDLGALSVQPRTYGMDGFINEHARWSGRNGLGFFQARIELSEPMTLRFLMGYDGPFRLWLDGKPFFTDLDGVNPCLPDKGDKAVALKRGVHTIHVGMDLACGHSWGFFLRFARKDLTPSQRVSGEYARPVYLPAE